MQKRVFLMLLVLIPFFYSCKSSSATKAEQMNKFVQNYLYMLRDGKLDKAYSDLISSGMREAFTKDEFAAFLAP